MLQGIDYGPEDLIIVADWIVTGRAGTALAFGEQRGRLYSEQSLGPDSARWSESRLMGTLGEIQ